jgi:outer membrane protein assembly factor BamB
MKKIALLGLLSVSILAADWPHWRGPNFDGSSPEKALPSSWSVTENVKWKAPLPGVSGSTPVVWGDRIFLSSPDSSKNLDLLCVDRKSGKVLWQKQVGVGDRTAGPRSNMTSPSPVTDGKRVVALYGTGDIAAFDFEGKELWKRNLGEEFGKFAIMWLYGSSPLIYEGRLYVQVLQTSPVPEGYTHARDGKTTRESYLLCIDPATGKDIWKHVRPSDAIQESKESYASPIPFEGPNGKEILIVGGDVVTGHDARNGNELWRLGGLNPKNDPWWRIVPSVVTGDGMIFASAPKRDPLFAIKAGGKGDVTATHLAWKLTENPTDWATPLFYNGRLVVLDGDRHVVTCLKPKTGEKIWSGKIEVREPIWSSPTGADGKIYLISESGTAIVLEAGDEFKIISTIPMKEGPVRSSIVASHGQLLIRTAENLYCIGK